MGKSCEINQFKANDAMGLFNNISLTIGLLHTSHQNPELLRLTFHLTFGRGHCFATFGMQ